MKDCNIYRLPVTCAYLVILLSVQIVNIMQAFHMRQHYVLPCTECVCCPRPPLTQKQKTIQRSFKLRGQRTAYPHQK